MTCPLWKLRTSRTVGALQRSGKDDFQQAQRCLLSVSLRLLSHEYRSSGATAGIIIYEREEFSCTFFLTMSRPLCHLSEKSFPWTRFLLRLCCGDGLFPVQRGLLQHRCA